MRQPRCQIRAAGNNLIPLLTRLGRAGIRVLQQKPEQAEVICAGDASEIKGVVGALASKITPR